MWLIEELVNPARKNPKLDDFFDQQTKTQSLVREFIQNSLDAVLDRNAPVEVVFEIDKIQKSKFQEYLKGKTFNLDKHLKSCGITVDNDTYRYLKIEDYNTKGLNGELNAKSFSGGKIAGGDFIGFWWSQGIQGDKITGSGGSHGVGKIKLSTSSELNFFLAETIRSKDQKKLLIGYSTLKWHHINGIQFESEGRFGKKKKGIAWPYEWEENSDRPKILNFEDDFNIDRKDNPGLSVIIPSIDNDINFQSIVSSVLSEYYFSILRYKLVVKVKQNGKTESIDKSNIEELAKEYLSDSFTELIKNSKEALKLLSGKLFYLNDESEYGKDPSYKLGDKDFYKDELEEIKQFYRNGELVGFSLPIMVTKKTNGGKKDIPTRFFLFTKKNLSEESLSDEIYIRGNLLLNREKNGSYTKVFSLVFVSTEKFETLSEYLKYAEDPGHDKWNQNTLDRNLKDLEFEGRAPLQIIRSANTQLFNFLNEIKEKKKVKGIYSDIFSIKEFKGGKSGKKVTPKPKPDPNTKKLPILDLKKHKDGFKLNSNKNFSKALEENLFSLPLKVKIETGYLNVEDKGIRAYDKFDYDLADHNYFDFEYNGVKIIEREQNAIILAINDSKFRFKCLGFDPNRDLDTRWELLV